MSSLRSSGVYVVLVGLALAGVVLPWQGATEGFKEVSPGVWWLWATRRTLALLVFTSVPAIVVGVPIGVLSGARAAGPEGGVSAALEFAGRVPSLLLVGTLRFWDPTLGVIALGCALTLVRTLEVARVVRNHVAVQSFSEYVDASRAVGGTATWRMRTHILPGLGRPLFATVALGGAASISLEALLSLVGLGMPTQYSTWGGGLGTVGDSGAGSTFWLAVLSIAAACYSLRRFGAAMSH